MVFRPGDPGVCVPLRAASLVEPRQQTCDQWTRLIRAACTDVVLDQRFGVDPAGQEGWIDVAVQVGDQRVDEGRRQRFDGG
jgi:hypothetical protein